MLSTSEALGSIPSTQDDGDDDDGGDNDGGKEEEEEEEEKEKEESVFPRALRPSLYITRFLSSWVEFVFSPLALASPCSVLY